MTKSFRDPPLRIKLVRHSPSWKNIRGRVWNDIALFNGKKYFTTNATRTPHSTPVAWDIPVATCGLKTWSWKHDFSLFGGRHNFIHFKHRYLVFVCCTLSGIQLMRRKSANMSFCDGIVLPNVKLRVSSKVSISAWYFVKGWVFSQKIWFLKKQ